MSFKSRHSGLLVPDNEGRLIVKRLDLSAGRLTEFGRQWMRERRPWCVMPEGIGYRSIEGGSGLSQYAESRIVDHANGRTSWTMPAGSYLCLCTATVTSASTGSTITEASYTGYARLSLAGNWTAATTGATPSVGQNTGAASFAACTGGTSTCTFFAICDAVTVGNMIWWGTLASVVISVTQTPATIAAGALTDQLT